MDKQRLIHIGVLSGVLIAIMVLLSSFLGFSRGGFDNQNFLFQFFLYGVYGIGCLIGILILIWVDNMDNTGDSSYGESVFFYSGGLFPSLNFKPFTKISNLVLGSLIISSIAGLYSIVVRQTSFSGIQSLQQQFTVFDSVLFNSLLVTASENLGTAFALALVVFFIKRYAAKNQLSKANYAILVYFFGILVFLVLGVGNHILRYGFSDYNLTIVAVFWSVGGLITLITGSFIPFWMMHISNNVFTELSKHLSNSIILIWTFVILVILSAWWVYLLFRKKKQIGVSA